MAPDDTPPDGPSIAPPTIGFGFRRKKKGAPAAPDEVQSVVEAPLLDDVVPESEDMASDEAVEAPTGEPQTEPTVEANDSAPAPVEPEPADPLGGADEAEPTEPESASARVAPPKPTPEPLPEPLPTSSGRPRTIFDRTPTGPTPTTDELAEPLPVAVPITEPEPEPEPLADPTPALEIDPTPPPEEKKARARTRKKPKAEPEPEPIEPDLLPEPEPTQPEPTEPDAADPVTESSALEEPGSDATMIIPGMAQAPTEFIATPTDLDQEVEGDVSATDSARARRGRVPKPVKAPKVPKPPKLPKTAREPKPPRGHREFVAPTWLAGRNGALITGALVGLVVVLATAGSLKVCTAVQGTSSCGGPGFFLLVAILVVATLLGSFLLRLATVPDPGSTSLLAVGLMAVVTLVFLVDSIFEWWMIIAIPVICVGTYALSHWVTTTFIDTTDS